VTAETTYRFDGDASELLAEIARIRQGMQSAAATAKQQGAAFSSFGTAAGAVADAQKKVAGSTKDAASEADKFIAKLKAEAEAAGKTRTELLGLKAAQLGVAGQVKGYIDQIGEASKHTHEFSFANASAKRELLVLAHELSQGNYKRFGGSMLVLAEQTGAASLLFSTLGISVLAATAIVGGFSYAVAKGAIEQHVFNDSLRLTGNYAGQTAETFRSTSQSIASSTGLTIGASKEMLQALISTGRFGPESIGAVTRAALELAHATGQSTEDVVKDFAKMADGSTKWATELNKQYHFLDLATFERIRRLEEQGQKEQAFVVISNAMHNSIGTQTEQLGNYAYAWRKVTAAVSGAVDALGNIGKTPSIDQQIDRLEKLIAERRALSERTLGHSGGADKASAALEAELEQLRARKALETAGAAARAEVSRRNEEGAAASERIKKLHEEFDARFKLRQELEAFDRDVKAYRADGGTLSAADEAALRHGIEKRYDKRDEADSLMQRIAAQRESVALTQQEVAAGGKLDEGEKFRLEVTRALNDANNHYTEGVKRRVLAQLDLYTAEYKALRQEQVAAAVARDAEQSMERRAKLTTQMGDSLNAFTAAQQKNLTLIREQSELIGKTAEERELIQQRRRVDEAEQAEQRKLDLLAQQAVRDMDADALAMIAKQREAVHEQADAVRNDLTAAVRERFRVEYDGYSGLLNAQAKYRDEIANTAALVESSLTKAFHGAEDAFVKFMRTGKVDLKSLVDGLADDILRGFYRQNFAKPVSDMLSSGFQQVAGMLGINVGGGGAGGAAGAASQASSAAQAAAAATQLAAGMEGAGLAADEFGMSLTETGLSADEFSMSLSEADITLMTMAESATAAAEALMELAASSASGGGGGMGGLGSLFSLFGGGGGAAGGADLASMFEMVAMFADGDTFPGGVRMAANSDIFNSPTLFRFANGGGFNMGVMGEAGPEAVMPLKRGPDGKLGVVSQGAAGAGVAQVNLGGIEVVNNLGVQAQARTEQKPDGGFRVILERVEDHLAGRMESGQGKLVKATAGRFGLNPASGAPVRARAA